MRVRTLVAVALLSPALARAEAPAPLPDTGPLLSVRAGLGVPSGEIARSGPEVADLVERKFPLGIELGYRLSRRFWAQVHLELAPGTAAPALCAGGTSCSASDIRLGATLLLRLLPGARLDPWVGAGVGVEILDVKGLDAASGVRTDWSWTGVDLPYLEAGIDLALSDRLSVGPWASLSFVRFSSGSARPTGGETVSGTIADREVHRWLAAGIQATLKL